MKAILTSLGLSFLFSFQAFSATHEGITPTLRYAKNIEYNHEHVSHNYLNVVVEDYKFPKGNQKIKFEKALSILEEIMNSEEFKKRVISYVNSNGKREFQKNYLWKDSDKKLTNEDVYNILIKGDEYMHPTTEGEMNLVSYVRKCSWIKKIVSKWCRAVIGSTSPKSSKRIALNWKFYSKFEIPQMVSNMVHEWIHLLGFLHGKKNMREEVPYVVGAIAGELASELLASN